MKIDYYDYNDFVIKLLEFKDKTLKNATFGYIDIIKEAIKWFSKHDYNKIKEIADESPAFENSFINSVYSLKSIIKEFSNTLPSRDKIMTAALDFKTMKDRYDEIVKNENTSESITRYKKRLTTLENKLNELSNRIQNIEKSEYHFQEDAESKMSNIQKLYDKVTAVVMKQSADAQGNIANYLKIYLDYIDKTKDDLNTKHEEAKSLFSDIVESIEDIKNDVHRNKLSRYFSDEQLKLKKPFKNHYFNSQYWGWLGGTFLGMFLIACFAVYVICSVEKGSVVTITQLFVRIPLMMILVWFTWFCSKQFSYIKQICDEYEYKYVLSESYIAYRDEARAITTNINDEHILAVLLESIIKNIATSPVQSVKLDAHIPFSELIGTLKSSIKTKDK